MDSSQVTSLIERLEKKEKELDFKMEKLNRLLEENSKYHYVEKRFSLENPNKNINKNRRKNKINKRNTIPVNNSKSGDQKFSKPPLKSHRQDILKQTNNFPNRTMKPINLQELSRKRMKNTNKVDSLSFLSLSQLRLHPDYPINFKYVPSNPILKKTIPNGQTKICYQNGDVQTQYSNGTVQIKHGKYKYIYFYNGDMMEEFPDGSTAYQYQESKTIEFKLPNETTYYLFSNGQRETHLLNGESIVFFPSGVQIHYDANGQILKQSKGLSTLFTSRFNSPQHNKSKKA